MIMAKKKADGLLVSNKPGPFFVKQMLPGGS